MEKNCTVAVYGRVALFLRRFFGAVVQMTTEDDMDIINRLRTVWPAWFELQPKTTAERKNLIEVQTLKADAADEIERLRGAMLTAASILERDGDEHSVGYALRRAMTPNV